MLTAGVPIDLPDSKAEALKEEPHAITISMDELGRVFLDSQELAPGELGDRLSAVVRDAGARLPLVTLRADRHLDYGKVIAVMGELNAAGFKTISLVTNEALGLFVAIAAHIALIVALVLSPLGRKVQPPPQRMTVSLSDTVADQATSPKPDAQAAPDLAPDLGEPDHADQPLPPAPQPVATPEPRPVPKPVAKPEPKPKPVAKVEHKVEPKVEAK
eukprot:gene15461-19572_t